MASGRRRTIFTMCWCEKLSGVAILLATLFISTLSTGSNTQECNIHDSFTSPNIEAFYEEIIPISGCQSSQTVATSKEVHVINLLSAPESVQPGQRVNVSLNVQQIRTVSQVRVQVVFVLNSAIPVTWVLTSDRRRSLPIFNYRIEIPQNTSIVYNDDLTVDLVDDAVLPKDNSDLLDWVIDRYQAVTTFSAVRGVNTINLKIGEDYVGPSSRTCNIQDNFVARNVEAYFVQDTAIRGCEIDQISKTSSIRQVHVIELNTASDEPIKAVPPRVIVDLTPVTIGKEHLYNVVLVLKADVAVAWDVRSTTVSGKLEILSPNQIKDDKVGFHAMSQRSDPSLLDQTGAGLVEWVTNDYGTVASYIEVDLANHFKITVKESTNTDGLPQGPKTISNDQVLGVPVLERIAHVDCRRDSITVTIPKTIINYFGLYQENIMLRDTSCEAEAIGDDVILESGLEECGMKKIVEEDKIIYENEIIFADSDYSTDNEGSGGTTTDPANLSNPPADDDNQPIERFPIKCEYKPNGEPITQRPPDLDPEGINNLDGRSDDVLTLLMDLYKSTTFTRTVNKFPHFAPLGSRIFFQVGLEGSDKMKVIPNHCWIAPGGSAVPVIIHELIVDGCPVDKTLVYHNSDTYNLKVHDMWVKQFSFQVPKLESDLLDFYVHCELGACSEDGSGWQHGIPLCSNVLSEVSTTCLVDARKLVQGPLRRMHVGPLQTNRNEQIPATRATPYKYDDRIVVQGLSAGPATAIAFAAFAMGVVLTACLWFIHAHTGPRTEPPASPQTVSTPSSPSGNGHILNGHIPNGFLMNGAVGNGYVPNGGINPNLIPAQQAPLMHGDPNAEEMV